jgi:hypothetical protein
LKNLEILPNFSIAGESPNPNLWGAVIHSP